LIHIFGVILNCDVVTLLDHAFVLVHCPSPYYTDAYSIDDDDVLAVFVDIVDVDF